MGSGTRDERTVFEGAFEFVDVPSVVHAAFRTAGEHGLIDIKGHPGAMRRAEKLKAGVWYLNVKGAIFPSITCDVDGPPEHRSLRCFEGEPPGGR